MIRRCGLIVAGKHELRALIRRLLPREQAELPFEPMEHCSSVLDCYAQQGFLLHEEAELQSHIWFDHGSRDPECWSPAAWVTIGFLFHQDHRRLDPDFPRGFSGVNVARAVVRMLESGDEDLALVIGGERGEIPVLRRHAGHLTVSDAFSFWSIMDQAQLPGTIASRLR